MKTRAPREPRADRRGVIGAGLNDVYDSLRAKGRDPVKRTWPMRRGRCVFGVSNLDGGLMNTRGGGSVTGGRLTEASRTGGSCTYGLDEAGLAAGQ